MLLALLAPSLLGLSLPWRSAVAPAGPAQAKQGLSQALETLAWPEDDATPDIVLLSVSQEHSSNLKELSSEAARTLGANLLIGVVGAGVIGGGRELEGEDSGISLLAGVLPEDTNVTPFVVGKESMPNWASLIGDEEKSKPSFLLFADPFSPVSQVTSIINSLAPGACVAGGLSCPTSEGAQSLAIAMRGAQCRTLPVGSVIGVNICGPRFRAHSLTAQGAAPVGPSFLVTSGGGEGGNMVRELDGEPALSRLQEVAQTADERVIKLLQRSLLVGLDSRDADATTTADDGFSDEPDYLIRQVMGVDNDGSIYVGDTVEPGKTRLQFHVRDAVAANDELVLRLGRYKLERTMSGGYSTPPLGCLLFSCNGRGRNMYDDADHDSTAIAEALGAPPTGGFFCNGEVGPIGVKGLSTSGDAPTYLHGFTSVLALMYEVEPSE